MGALCGGGRRCLSGRGEFGNQAGGALSTPPPPPAGRPLADSSRFVSAQTRPLFELRCSNNVVHLHTCADSCAALANLIQYVVNHGDLHPPPRHDSPTEIAGQKVQVSVALRGAACPLGLGWGCRGRGGEGRNRHPSALSGLLSPVASCRRAPPPCRRARRPRPRPSTSATSRTPSSTRSGACRSWPARAVRPRDAASLKTQALREWRSWGGGLSHPSTPYAHSLPSGDRPPSGGGGGQPLDWGRPLGNEPLLSRLLKYGTPPHKN